MLLYHGTTVFNALSILNNGFSFNYSGTNWGNTYGKAIYFSPNYNTAKFYAGIDGIVLSFNFFIDDFYVLPFFQWAYRTCTSTSSGSLCPRIDDWQPPLHRVQRVEERH